MEALIATVVTIVCCFALFSRSSTNLKLLGIAGFSAAYFTYLGTSEAGKSSKTAIKGTNFPRLIDATVEDLVSGLEKGLFTSVDLVNAYTRRIAEVNETVHAVTQLNPDALSIAQHLDSERAIGIIRSPVHGLPVLVKNNIATNDALENTAGSYALLGAKVPRDSVVASKLRSSGVIILGKANLSQWARWRTLNISNGWSAVGGQTVGPYYPDQDPSGSSSGSGVASALGLAAFSLGSETSGSITSPSHRNNIVGIKPTVGLTSRDLVVPISSHQDTVGPMAGTVKDAAYLLSAIAGTLPHDTDNYTSAQPFTNPPDYVSACNFSALLGARLGIPRNVLDVPSSDPAYQFIQAFDAVLPLLRSAGATIIDNTNYTGYAEFQTQGLAEYSALTTDFATDLQAYLGQLTKNPNNITSLSDLLAFTHNDPRESWPARDHDHWTRGMALGYNNTSPVFWKNHTTNARLAGPLGVTGALQNHSLDALILPTNFAYSLPAILGSPIISVPLGVTPPNTPVTKDSYGDLNANGPNFPFGISFFAERWSEEKLIGLAYAFEQRTKVRQTIKPWVEPKTELVDVVHERTGSAKSKTKSGWESLQKFLKR